MSETYDPSGINPKYKDWEAIMEDDMLEDLSEHDRETEEAEQANVAIENTHADKGDEEKRAEVSQPQAEDDFDGYDPSLFEH